MNKECSFTRGAWGWQICLGPFDLSRAEFGKWTVSLGRRSWSSTPPGTPQ